VKVKEKYFKKQYRPACTLVNVKPMVYFKYKLKFGNRKIYASIIANFQPGSS
jgi:hypothetical protein